MGSYLSDGGIGRVAEIDYGMSEMCRTANVVGAHVDMSYNTVDVVYFTITMVWWGDHPSSDYMVG